MMNSSQSKLCSFCECAKMAIPWTEEDMKKIRLHLWIAHGVRLESHADIYKE